MLIFIFCFLAAAILSRNEAANVGQQWGTYRPGVYFGVRAKTPTSPLFGLMWTDIDRQDMLNHIRHNCDDRDAFERFGYVSHDGVSYGKQYLPDHRSGVNITTEFREVNGGWVARVRGERFPKPNTWLSPPPKHIGLFWYLTVEAGSFKLKSKIKKGNSKVNKGIVDDVELISAEGKYEDLLSDGGRLLLVRKRGDNLQHPNADRLSGKSKKKMSIEMSRTAVWGTKVDEDKKWDAKDFLRSRLDKHIQKIGQRFVEVLKLTDDQGRIDYRRLPHLMPSLPNKVDPNSNLFLFQEFVALPFEFTFMMYDNSLPSPVQEPNAIPRLMAFAEQAFEARFEAMISQTSGLTDTHIKVCKAALSNMLGGLGYYYGRELVKEDPDTEFEKVVESDNAEIFTACPCRSFFPRGFLWDEGFHQLLISQWSPEISVDVLISWLSLIDENGWIGREQIRGHEARERVPSQFRAQRRDVANPPTLFLALKYLLNLDSTNNQSCSADDSAEICFADGSREVSFKAKLWDYLEANWDRVKAHGLFLHDTQISTYDKTSFRWNGRTEGHCLASGLDDYPRGTGKITKKEGHVDAHAWIIVTLDILALIAKQLNFEKDYNQLSSRATDLRESLDKLHWNDEDRMFQDYIVSTETNEPEFVRHTGYVSIWPFLLRLLHGDDDRIFDMLDIIEDEEGIASKFGLRSLAKSDELFGTNENYWRGPIWINVNYLAISALYHYKETGFTQEIRDACKATYDKLRLNVIDNIASQYEEKGYLYEQYHPISGEGQRAHPFTGWTALVVNMIAERYH